MDVINVSDVKSLIAKAHATLCVVLHALDTKILVGEINHPVAPVEKKPRKKRTPKVKVSEPGMIVANILDSSFPDVIKIKRKRRTKKEMELEKQYRAERHEPLNLPDADKGKAGEFFKKKEPTEK